MTGSVTGPPFSRAQLDRYGRHLLLDEVGVAGQRALLGAHALVIGAGGLGAPVLAYLAAAGVGRITLLDPDRIDASNLQRQVLFGTGDVGRLKVEVATERLAALNPEVRLEARPEAFGRDNALELAAAADVVVDGSDTFPSRYLANDACVLTGRPLVYGAVARFEGQVGVFHAPLPERDGGGRGPCYRCLYPDPPPPGSVPSCAEAGVLGALPGAIGSLMAGEAIKLLAGVGEPLAGALLHLDLLRGETHRFEAPRDPACPVCGDAPTVTELIDYEAFCGL